MIVGSTTAATKTITHPHHLMMTTAISRPLNAPTTTRPSPLHSADFWLILVRKFLENNREGSWWQVGRRNVGGWER